MAGRILCYPATRLLTAERKLPGAARWRLPVTAESHSVAPSDSGDPTGYRVVCCVFRLQTCRQMVYFQVHILMTSCLVDILKIAPISCIFTGNSSIIYVNAMRCYNIYFIRLFNTF